MKDRIQKLEDELITVQAQLAAAKIALQVVAPALAALRKTEDGAHIVIGLGLFWQHRGDVRGGTVTQIDTHGFFTAGQWRLTEDVKVWTSSKEPRRLVVEWCKRRLAEAEAAMEQTDDPATPEKTT